MGQSMNVQVAIAADLDSDLIADGTGWREVYNYKPEPGSLLKGRFGLANIEAMHNFKRLGR